MTQKIGILLEEEMLRRAKRHAADEGRPLSDLIQDALEEYLTAGLRGRDAVVAVSANEIGKRSRRRDSLIEFFRRSPLAGVNLDIARGTDTGRRVDLCPRALQCADGSPALSDCVSRSADGSSRPVRSFARVARGLAD